MMKKSFIFLFRIHSMHPLIVNFKRKKMCFLFDFHSKRFGCFILIQSEYHRHIRLVHVIEFDESFIIHRLIRFTSKTIITQIYGCRRRK